MPPIKDLGPDEGYVQIQISGVTLEVCPTEELERIHSRLGDKTSGQPMLQIIREYIAERTAAQGPDCERRVSSSMARRFYETLLEAETEIADFFGFPQSLQGSSGSSLPTSAATESGLGLSEKSEGT